MINACKQAGLPDPEIKEQDGWLLVTLFKDRYTEQQLSKLGLNDRQVKAVNFVREHGQITNKKYVVVAAVSPRQALTDLKELVEKKVLILIGKGRSVRYLLRK